MTAKIQITDAFKSGWNNDWHLQANIGPFSSREEANEFAKKILALEPQGESPPALGVSVSETIAMKDRFG